jgi:cytochrome bd-I ubiquinol oxidase subunit X
LRRNAILIMIDSDPIKETAMWYFAWILGIGVALGFGIINVMWLDAYDTFAPDAVDGAHERMDHIKDPRS